MLTSGPAEGRCCRTDAGSGTQSEVYLPHHQTPGIFIVYEVTDLVLLPRDKSVQLKLPKPVSLQRHCRWMNNLLGVR